MYISDIFLFEHALNKLFKENSVIILRIVLLQYFLEMFV